MQQGHHETATSRRGLWLIGLAAFFLAAGFFAVLLAPHDKPPQDAAGPETQVRPEAQVRTETVPAQAVATKADATTSTAAPAAPEVATAEPVAAPEPMPPALPKDGVPKVAILLANLGTQPAAARAAIAALPAEISLGFSPYGSELAALTDAARKKGHEIWVGVPMQPKRYPQINPGKNTLLLSLPAAENVKRLAWAVAQVPGAKNGLYNHMGSAFTASAQSLAPVLEAAKAQGLMFVDARSGLDTVGPKVAASTGVRAALSRGFLDDEPAQVKSRLEALVAAARKDGAAIGMIEARPASVSAVKDWAARLEAQGVQLVTAGQLAN